MKDHGRGKSAKRRDVKARLSWLTIEMLEPRQLLAATPQLLAYPNLSAKPLTSFASADGYTPAEIQHAYGFDKVKFGAAKVNGDGTGQTIAIVDAYDDPNILADLKTFDKQFSLSDPPSFTKVSQTGSTSALPKFDAGWAQEISLDVEWAHAIAPKASILLVETKSENLQDLVAGVDYARKAAGVSVVSMSWGLSEFNNEGTYDSHFTTPAGHIGVTFVAASGDDGAGVGATWPAVSSNVLSVGGTSLTINSSTGAYISETAWRDSSGGTSRFETAPGYQSAVEASAPRRVAPDVAYDANPNTGFDIYDSEPYQGGVGWQVFGGTSAGTPQWAALIAIADQGRVLQGGKTLDGASGTLPALYALYSNTGAYDATFHDIVSGGSGGGGFGGRFHTPTLAQAGYDIVTGLGTPQAPHAIGALLAARGGTVAKTKVASVKTTTKAGAKIALVKRQTISETAMQVAAVSEKPSAALKIDVPVPPLITALDQAAVIVANRVVKTIDSYAGLEASNQSASNSLSETTQAGSVNWDEPTISNGDWKVSIIQGEIEIWRIIPRMSQPAGDAVPARALFSVSSLWKQAAAFLASAAAGAAAIYGRRSGGRKTAKAKRYSLFNLE